MTLASRLRLGLAALFIATVPLAAQTAAFGPHVWEAPSDPATFEKRITAQIDLAQKQIDQLLAVKGARTVANTLAPYDDALQHLDAAAYQAGLMQNVSPVAAIRDKAQEMVQKVSAVSTTLALNQALYKALAAMDVSQADPATKYYVERTLLEFRLSGVDKDDATRARIKALSDDLTKSGTQFSRNLADSQLKVIVKDPKELAGLPDDYIQRHKPGPDGTITLTSDSPDVTPVLKFSKNPDLRQRVYLAYNNRAYPQNIAVLADLLKNREQLANILGYQHWADMNAADKMAVNSQSIAKFIDEIDVASKPASEREYTMLLATARKDNPGLQQIGIQDRSYYFEQLRRSEFNFNSQEARPYLPYDEVEAGILSVAAKLFHVTFKPAPEAQVWDPSVKTFDVYDGATRLGRIYLDMHPREGKDQWFSSNPVLDGIRGKQLPEAALVCNFSGGRPGDPGLMEYGEVTTFFHEFGHLMHWIFQGQQPWAGFGNNLEADFVEAPSQMLEEWMHDPKVLATFARHYQTGEPIPAALVAKANRADAFGRGLWARFQLVYTSVSFDLHNMPPQKADIEQAFPDNMRRFTPFDPLKGDNQIASFSHLTGYSSAYYTYLWDKVIAEDLFSQFNRNDLLASEVALRYRSTILERTGSMPINQLLRTFLGRPQAIDSFKVWMNQEFEGLPASAAGAAK